MPKAEPGPNLKALRPDLRDTLRVWLLSRAKLLSIDSLQVIGANACREETFVSQHL